jgi:Uncharacterised nucleotidyltransferase
MNSISTPAEHLLVLLSFARMTAKEIGEVQALASRIVDWNAFADLAASNATVPLVRSNLETAGILGALPASVVARFDAETSTVKAANAARLGTGKALLARLAEQGVPVVILKGILFAETIYGNTAYKKMNDVDILIKREHLAIIYSTYEELGFFSAAELFGGASRKVERLSHHAAPFFSRDLSCMVGTHWGLITPLAPYTLDYDAIWSRVVEVDLGGQGALSMAPEDNLHHLCVHLPYYKTGVRELADIYNLLRHHGATFDWDLFLREVQKARTENLVYHALCLSHRLAPRVDVEDVLRALRPRVSFYFVRDARKKTRRVGRLLRSRSVHMSRIEKAYADFSATKDAAEKRTAFRRILGGILRPPAEDVVKLSALDEPSAISLFLARLAAPWRISRVFTRDLGAGIYAAMLAKCTFEVCRTTLTASLGRSDPSEQGDYARYAERLGVTVDALSKLKEALE